MRLDTCANSRFAARASYAASRWAPRRHYQAAALLTGLVDSVRAAFASVKARNESRQPWRSRPAPAGDQGTGSPTPPVGTGLGAILGQSCRPTSDSRDL